MSKRRSSPLSVTPSPLQPCLQQQPNRVGQLDLATLARRRLLAARRRSPGLNTYRAATARSLGASSTSGFSITSSSSNTAAVAVARFGDPVVHDFRPRHTFERHHDVRVRGIELLDHAGHDVRLGVQPDDRIAQGHDKRLVAHQRTGTQHGVPQSQLAALSRVEILHLLPFELQIHQLLFAPCLAQVGRQLFVDVEMLLDRRLAARRHEQDAADAGQSEFLHHVLHHRLAADGQHLLRLTLRGRQQPGAMSGHGNNRNVNGHGQVSSVLKFTRSRTVARSARVDRYRR